MPLLKTQIRQKEINFQSITKIQCDLSLLTLGFKFIEKGEKLQNSIVHCSIWKQVILKIKKTISFRLNDLDMFPSNVLRSYLEQSLMSSHLSCSVLYLALKKWKKLSKRQRLISIPIIFGLRKKYWTKTSQNCAELKIALSNVLDEDTLTKIV